MWRLCVIALLAFGAVSADDKAHYRLHSQKAHIDSLEEDVGKLEQAFGKLSRPLKQWDEDMIAKRVARNEDDKCPPGEVSCGGDFPECISQLFVCDGYVDCHNGHDEDEATCESEMVHVGSTYQGIVEWDTCEHILDANIILTITSVLHDPIFNSRVYVRATFVGDSTRYDNPHPVATAMHGDYSFAERKLMLTPDKVDKLHHPYNMVCVFNHGDNEHADCSVNERGSGNPCAKARVVAV